MKHIVIDAKHYDTALAFVNERRAENGLPPILELPPGIPWDPTSCPCATSCGREISVIGESWLYTDEDYVEGKKVHKGLGEFTFYFDVGCGQNNRDLALPIRGQ